MLHAANIAHYLVYSDNWNRSVMTKKCYEKIRLEMSSGDFGSHAAVPFNWQMAMLIAKKEGQKYIYHTGEEDRSDSKIDL